MASGGNARHAGNDPDRCHAHVIGHLEHRAKAHEDDYTPPF